MFQRKTDLPLSEIIRQLPIAPDGPAKEGSALPNCLLANELGIIFCQEKGGKLAEDALVLLLQGEDEGLSYIAGCYLSHETAPSLSSEAQTALKAAS